MRRLGYVDVGRGRLIVSSLDLVESLSYGTGFVFLHLAVFANLSFEDQPGAKDRLALGAMSRLLDSAGNSPLLLAFKSPLFLQPFGGSLSFAQDEVLRKIDGKSG